MKSIKFQAVISALTSIFFSSLGFSETSMRKDVNESKDSVEKKEKESKRALDIAEKSFSRIPDVRVTTPSTMKVAPQDIGPMATRR